MRQRSVLLPPSLRPPVAFILRQRVGQRAAGSVIAGGVDNDILADATFATIAGGNVNQIRNNANYSTIGGGGGSIVFTNAQFATIAGGGDNRIEPGANSSVIGGGLSNLIRTNSVGSTIAGGVNHIIRTSHGFIGGGNGQVIESSSIGGVIVGGSLNTIGGFTTNGTIGGGHKNVLGSGSGFGTVAGGAFNEVKSVLYGSIGGGLSNSVVGFAATVPGGLQNEAKADYAFAAGRRAIANHQGSFVWADSTDADFLSTANNQFLIRAAGGVGIGVTNPTAPLHVMNGTVNAPAVSGGTILILERAGANYISMLAATNGEQGILFGDATDSVEGAIVFNTPGNTNGLQLRTGNNSTRMTIDSSGRVGIGTTSPTNPLQMASGAYVSAGGTWTSVSDVNRKQHFEPVDVHQVLDRVATLPITTWSYIAEPGVKHIGPTAQDFHAAFGVGVNDVSLSQIDPDGVALAAIQGLVSEVRGQKSEVSDRMAELEEENARLRLRLEVLEKKLGM